LWLKAVLGPKPLTRVDDMSVSSRGQRTQQGHPTKVAFLFCALKPKQSEHRC